RRPSIVAQYAAHVAQWLREDPAISAIEILRRAQALGYNGGKSALYELVRRVRTLDERPGGSRQLIVVSPDREHLYNFFKRSFEGNATVQIILDRRVERPAAAPPPGSGGPPPKPPPPRGAARRPPPAARAGARLAGPEMRRGPR